MRTTDSALQTFYFRRPRFDNNEVSTGRSCPSFPGVTTCPSRANDSYNFRKNHRLRYQSIRINVKCPSHFRGDRANRAPHIRLNKDTAVTILRKPIKRELPEPIARRQIVVELHPGFIRFREKRSRTAWDISWESVYWKAAEIKAREGRSDRDSASNASFRRR